MTENDRIIICPRNNNTLVNEGHIESSYLINVDISEEKDDLVKRLKEAEEVIEYYSKWNKLVRDGEGVTSIDTILASEKACQYLDKYKT